MPLDPSTLLEDLTSSQERSLVIADAILSLQEECRAGRNNALDLKLLSILTGQGYTPFVQLDEGEIQSQFVDLCLRKYLSGSSTFADFAAKYGVSPTDHVFSIWFS